MLWIRIRIQIAAWIRIRNRNADPDPAGKIWQYCNCKMNADPQNWLLGSIVPVYILWVVNFKAYWRKDRYIYL